MPSAAEVHAEIITPDGKFPEAQHKTDVGFDLTYTGREPLVVEQGKVHKIPCGCAIAIPTGYAGLICPRSGLAIKHGITVVNAPGIIDPGYRGELGVLLTKLTSGSFIVDKGTRIAQLLVVPATAWISPKQGIFAGDTDRGIKGFGSTG